ncbi:rhomboid family intramembrane serine protease [Bacteroidia bacterium]|nr:rhomboid family intramembrane serine protease [Bacteroidia bacterium]MDB4107807.1 rhomboid family intramembrane serine protease [Bacteroidia bacterium]
MQFRSNQFNAPEVTKNLIIINVLFFLATYLLQSKINLYQYLALFHFSTEMFKPWQIITHMFMHGGFSHLIFNMIALYFVGSRLEQVWGAKKYLNFYLITGLGAALLHAAVQTYEINHGMISPYSSSVGASGAIYGLLVAFALYWPNTEFLLYFVLPIKAKYLVLGAIAIALFSGFTGADEGVAHFAHLGGALFGYLLVKYWNKNNRASLY